MLEASAKRLVHFSYPYRPTRGEEKTRLHRLRDGDAAKEVAPVLCKQGYEYGGLLLNFPRPHSTGLADSLGPEDLIFLATRPPLNDDAFDRRYIRRSGTRLERDILDAVGLHFDTCRRSLVVLRREMAERLSRPDRGEMEFRIYRGPTYLRLRRPYGRTRKERQWRRPKAANATAAFLLRTLLWEGGPTLLNVFGMDAAMTLIWCYFLRTRFRRLLDGPRFAMAEILCGPIPENPGDLSFADDWKVEILLDHALEQTPLAVA